MRSFFVETICFFICILSLIGIVDYSVDPANLFHNSIVADVVDKLNEGEVVFSPGDMNEGAFVEALLVSDDSNKLKTVIIGSSRVMYLPWDKVYADCVVGAMSGSYLGDYYGVIGILEYNNILPERIVIGVDPWAMYTDVLSGRHTEIVKYAEYENDMVSYGHSAVHPEISERSLLRRIKELLSIGYFQSSIRTIVDNIQLDGSPLLHHRKELVEVVDNIEIESVAKILPNGQRIMSITGLKAVEDNDKEAEDCIRNRSIYQLGGGYNYIESEKNLSEFKKLVDHLIEKGVEVQIYLPSWYPEVYELFETDRAYYGVIELEEEIRDIARKREITVHGSYNPDLCGVEKTDYADWLHLKGDKMYENYSVIVEE